MDLRSTATLRVELHSDGGIRLQPPTGAGGLASTRMARQWIDDAVQESYGVEVTGDAAAPVHADLLGYLKTSGAQHTVTAVAAEPWNDGWTSLKVAANSGLAEQAGELAKGGADRSPRRGPGSPYRLAMHHGHVATLVALRDAGVSPPSGSRPPDVLPDAVVLRNYLPGYVWWVAIASAVAGIVLAVILQQWPFLILAALGAVLVVVGNLVVGRTRIAVDGAMLTVRQVVRWQGPIDVGDLTAIGYAPAVSRRMSGRWRFVQTEAGDPYRRTAYQGFEPSLADRLKERDDLRVITVYCGRGFLSPGFQRHLAPYVLSSSAMVSVDARRVFERLST